MSEKPYSREVYMDLVDFFHELGDAKGGNTVHPSIRDLRERHPCCRECGIVKVKVEHIETVQDPNYKLDKARTARDWEEYKQTTIAHYKEQQKYFQERIDWFQNRIDNFDEIREQHQKRMEEWRKKLEKEKEE